MFTIGVSQRMDRVDLDDFCWFMKDAFEHLMDVADDPDLDDAFYECRLKNELCAEWALEG